MQKIAVLFPVCNVDDFDKDWYYYKKPKSSDAVSAKIVSLSSKYEFIGTTSSNDGKLQ